MDAAKLSKGNGTGKSKNGAGPDDGNAEWDSFNRLTEKLLRVPKRDVDEKRKGSKG